MPDTADSALRRLTSRTRRRVQASYPYAVIRRFIELELLERSLALSAQAFIALLPLIIMITSLFFSNIGSVLATQVGDRFGLDMVTRVAIQQLFLSGAGERVISWLAVVMVLVSAFALARRLGRVYAMIFGLPQLKRSENWRGLVWIIIQVTLAIVASSLRQVRVDAGAVIAILAVVVLLVVWFAADFVSLRLLVPQAPRALVLASAGVATVGRTGMGIWAAVYFANSLASQAQQYGPIGVTFALYTYLLVAVLIYVCSPLLVTTWVRWRQARVSGSPA